MPRWRDRLRFRKPVVADVPALPHLFADESNEVVEGVIVIPDISGYTQLVSGVALVHAQGIVTRLMGAIIGSGWERMTVSKLLGDAVLMYVSPRGASGETSPPELQANVLSRIRGIYAAFRRERDNTGERVSGCPCDACQTTHKLELKFIVHYGQFLVHAIDRFREMLGRDVILAFRLLKNHAPGHRYVLMTDPFIALDRALETQLSSTFEESYEHLGSVRVGIVDPAEPFDG